jgi:hypothetical protein
MLGYAGRDFYDFDDHSYRWIVVKRFEIVGEATTDRAILAALLAHPRYRDHYTSADSHEIDCGPLHGPYRLEAITVDSFEPVSEDTALEVVKEFAELLGGASEPLLQKLVDGVYPLIREARTRYRLRRMPDEALHEFGEILWEFREVVAIGSENTTAALIVTGVD